MIDIFLTPIWSSRTERKLRKRFEFTPRQALWMYTYQGDETPQNSQYVPFPDPRPVGRCRDKIYGKYYADYPTAAYQEGPCFTMS